MSSQFFLFLSVPDNFPYFLYRIIPIPIKEKRVIDDFNLPAPIRTPDNHPGLNHFSNGNAKWLIRMSRDSIFIFHKKILFLIFIFQAFKYDPIAFFLCDILKKRYILRADKRTDEM